MGPNVEIGNPEPFTAFLAGLAFSARGEPVLGPRYEAHLCAGQFHAPGQMGERLHLVLTRAAVWEVSLIQRDWPYCVATAQAEEDAPRLGPWVGVLERLTDGCTGAGEPCLGVVMRPVAWEHLPRRGVSKPMPHPVGASGPNTAISIRDLRERPPPLAPNRWC